MAENYAKSYLGLLNNKVTSTQSQTAKFIIIILFMLNPFANGK